MRPILKLVMTRQTIGGPVMLVPPHDWHFAGPGGIQPCPSNPHLVRDGTGFRVAGKVVS